MSPSKERRIYFLLLALICLVPVQARAWDGLIYDPCQIEAARNPGPIDAGLCSGIWTYDDAGRLVDKRFQGVDTRLLMPDEIIGVYRPRERIMLHGYSIDITTRGDYVLQQAGRRSCGAASMLMLAMSKGKTPDANMMALNYHVDLCSSKDVAGWLKEMGLEPECTFNRNTRSRISLIQRRTNLLGPAILAIDGELGGHFVIIDRVSGSKGYVVLRDPWHGWQVRVPIDVLRKRLPGYVDMIQTVSPEVEGGSGACQPQIRVPIGLPAPQLQSASPQTGGVACQPGRFSQFGQNVHTRLSSAACTVGGQIHRFQQIDARFAGAPSMALQAVPGLLEGCTDGWFPVGTNPYRQHSEGVLSFILGDAQMASDIPAYWIYAATGCNIKKKWPWLDWIDPTN